MVKSGGGTVAGDVRVPLGTSDFASYLLQAQGSGAQVLGLANAGADFSNSLKAAAEFGLTKTMRPAALLVFVTDVHSVGLDIAQGLVLTTAWYWDLDERTRAFAKKFYDKVKKEPTFQQAAVYSATLAYLKRERRHLGALDGHGDNFGSARQKRTGVAGLRAGHRAALAQRPRAARTGKPR